MRASPAATKAAPRRFDIGEKSPLEVTILRDGTIRMREQGRRPIRTTSIAQVYYATVRSEALNDIRRRQRRAQLLSTAGSGVRR